MRRLSSYLLVISIGCGCRAPAASSDVELGEAEANGGFNGMSDELACSAPAATAAELTRGAVSEGTRVELTRLLVTSYEFLVFHSKSSGACLWGVYAADADTVEHAGVLLVAYGDSAQGEAPCALDTDAIWGGVQPGDRVTARGTVSRYAPSACSNLAPSVQLLLEARCPLSLAGSGPLFEPSPLGNVEADGVAAAEPSAISRWGGRLVSLPAQAALAAADGVGSVAPYGVVRLGGTALELHDALSFMDVRGSGPADPGKSLRFPASTRFSRLVGVVHLDYCTWALAPRDACVDLAPPSANCPE